MLNELSSMLCIGVGGGSCGEAVAIREVDAQSLVRWYSQSTYCTGSLSNAN